MSVYMTLCRLFDVIAADQRALACSVTSMSRLSDSEAKLFAIRYGGELISTCLPSRAAGT